MASLGVPFPAVDTVGATHDRPGLLGEPASYRPPADAATPRVVKLRPMLYAAALLIGASLVFWINEDAKPPLLVALALVVFVAYDSVASWRSLRGPHLELRNPPDAVAGGHVTYLLRATGLVRPLLVSPAGPFRRHAVLVEHEGPGMITLPSPPRGVVRYLVLDLVSSGPMGFIETTRRVLVPLPVPMLVAPPMLEHVVHVPDDRPLGFGEAEQAPVGEDLFRAVREYVRGDSRRKVHWPASAHHGSLMVRETDGTGVAAIRIVLVLHLPGPGSEVAAGRAAFLAESCARRGWIVHLVTVENPGEPVLPDLGRPLSYLPRLLPPPSLPPHTVSRQVTRRMEVARRLSLAGYGSPTLDRWHGLTRIVSAAGDHWL